MDDILRSSHLRDILFSLSLSVSGAHDSVDTQTRLEFYQLSSPSPSYTHLLPWGSSAFLSNLYICIVLDWTVPSTLLPQLQAWLHWLHQCLEPHSLQPWYQALQARLVLQFQGLCNSGLPVAAINQVPLPQGMLTRNLGVPFSIICTKSDRISNHLHEGVLSNDSLDALQYSLRKEAFTFGSSLHYTSLSKPNTLENLRSTVHLFLFTHDSDPRPQPSPSHVIRPNVVDHEEIIVPHGWDTVPKMDLLLASTTGGLINTVTTATTATPPPSLSKPTTTTTATATWMMAGGGSSVQAEPDGVFLASLMNQFPTVPPPPAQDQNAVLANFFQSILAQSSSTATVEEDGSLH